MVPGDGRDYRKEDSTLMPCLVTQKTSKLSRKPLIDPVGMLCKLGEEGKRSSEITNTLNLGDMKKNII